MSSLPQNWNLYNHQYLSQFPLHFHHDQEDVSEDLQKVMKNIIYKYEKRSRYGAI